MIWKVLICVVIIFTTFSCGEYMPFGRRFSEQGEGGTQGPFNYNAGPSCSSNGNDWGGISCQGGSDEGIKNFLTSDTIIDPSSEDFGYNKVECQPGNNQGIIFHLSLDFSGDVSVDLNGNNNNLTLSRSSKIVIRIASRTVLDVELPAVDGEINGNQANFKFADDLGSVTLEGTLDPQFFTGQVRFKNDRKLADIEESGNRIYDNPGLEGVLGNFKISSCSAFPSSK